MTYQQRDQRYSRQTVSPPARQETTPFDRALNAARQFRQRDDDKSVLVGAVALLSDAEKHRLMMRVRTDVLEDRCELPAAFAVAYAVGWLPVLKDGQPLLRDDGKPVTRGMVPVAAQTALVHTLLHRHSLTPEDLVKVGLAEVRSYQDNQGRTNYGVGYPIILRQEDLLAVAEKLRGLGSDTSREGVSRFLYAATEIRSFVNEQSRRRLTRQAERDARDTAEAAAKEAAAEAAAQKAAAAEAKKAAAEAKKAAASEEAS